MPIILKVKEVATQKGWTQSRLQRAANVHSKTMSGIYNNPSRDVSYSILVRIAHLLDVRVEDLAEEIPEKNS